MKPGDKAFSRGHRKSLDVSFLTNNNTIAVIYEAHISVIVVGTGEKRWTAYSFADTYFDPDGEPGEDEFSYQFSMADPIIAGRCPIDANKPDWNPRAYFMMAVRNRMEQVTREWRVLVGQLKIGIKDFRALNPSLIGSIGAPRNSDEDILDPLKWTTRICQLVNDLMEVLAKTKGELNAFMADDGDIQYFVKSEGPYPEVDDTICNSLRDIKGFLDELRSCKRELKYVLRSREEHIRVAQLHQLHLTRESSHAVQRNVSATDITVLAISPIAVVSTVFAIPTNVLWFTRNFQSFSLSVLAMAVSIQILSYLLATWREHIVVRRWWNRLAGCQMKGGRDTAETHAVERFNTTDHRPQSGGSHRTDTIDTMETLVGGTIPSLQVETV